MSFINYSDQKKTTFILIQRRSLTDLRSMFQFVICDKQYFSDNDVFEIYVCTKPFRTYEKSPQIIIIHYNLSTESYMIFKPLEND